MSRRDSAEALNQRKMPILTVCNRYNRLRNDFQSGEKYKTGMILRSLEQHFALEDTRAFSNHFVEIHASIQTAMSFEVTNELYSALMIPAFRNPYTSVANSCSTSADGIVYPESSVVNNHRMRAVTSSRCSVERAILKSCLPILPTIPLMKVIRFVVVGCVNVIALPSLLMSRSIVAPIFQFVFI
ncbi:unnamed protein product [Haemonchus placei]|uniref:Uncharacterized protein n=1 Tax=Haemonchus placei TaxID=6290 RepID=A0A0N4X5L4_HAEPC|nr:unnamed protein product [Haemonchus placei]